MRRLLITVIARRLLITVLLALLVGGLFGWRAHITFDRPDVHNVPVPVRTYWFERLA